jgi:hypothetical protein
MKNYNSLILRIFSFLILFLLSFYAINCNDDSSGKNNKPKSTDSNGSTMTSVQQDGNSAQQGDNPPQLGGNSAQQGGNPPQQGGNPPQLDGNPPQQGGNPPQPWDYNTIKEIIQLILIITLFISILFLYLFISNVNKKVIDTLRIISDLRANELSLLKEELSKKASNSLINKIGDIERKQGELQEDLESLSSKKFSSELQTKSQKSNQKTSIYKYYRLIDSSEETDENDKRAFFRIWESAGQYNFDINPDNQSHLTLIQRSDSYLKDFFDYKNLDGNKIKTLSSGTLEIQGDGQFKIIKNSEIEII